MTLDEVPLERGVRYWRLRRGYSQERLAEISGVALSVLRKLEQQNGRPEGPQGVRLGTLSALARALGVQTAQLFPATAPGPADQDPAQLALLPIRIALTPPLLLAEPSVCKPSVFLELSALQQAVVSCIRLYDEDRYDELAPRLAELLQTAHPTVLDDAGARALRLRSGVYQMVGWFLAQVGAHDLAYQAVRDALTDARGCGDPLVAASCVICECWLFIRQGRLLDAKRLAIATADSIEPSRLRDADAEHLAVWGWLLLLAWSAAVRNNQADEALDFLRIAASAGAGSSQRHICYERYWSTLGSSTVAMKEVEHEVIVGDCRKAVQLAERLPPGSPTRADNRQRHLLTLAVAHAEIGNKTEALGILTSLRETAPQWLRHQRAGRATARNLIAAPARALPAEARALADFYDFGA